MKLKHDIAICISKISMFVIKHFTNKNASNFPGKLALKVDKHFLRTEVKKKITGKTIIVVGTNGKTSVTNMIADVLTKEGFSVISNRSGANMTSGICTALISAEKSDVGVFESDELWLKLALPEIDADYVLLLNLFRDQLDRCGEIERVQATIVDALSLCPKSQLIYNADDPFCESVARKVGEARNHILSRNDIAFGTDVSLEWDQNTTSDTALCQECGSLLKYDFRQYDKLGKYECPKCAFKRSTLDFFITNVDLSSNGLTVEVSSQLEGKLLTIVSKLRGMYNAYNMLACVSASLEMGASLKSIEEALRSFSPKNGRLQAYTLENQNVLLNLAKNPTGFNQNLRIIVSSVKGASKTTIAFFVNDKTADGHDVSWIWDCDFEELLGIKNASFFSGGSRKRDIQVRLKHAGIKSRLCEEVDEVLLSGAPDVFVIANYTALPEVKEVLDKYELKHEKGTNSKIQTSDAQTSDTSDTSKEASKTSDTYITYIKSKPKHYFSENPIKIAHILPDLLNLYGDGGNVRVLFNRMNWRGIGVEVVPVKDETDVNFSEFDIIVMGGSPDREQEIACKITKKWKSEIANHIEAGKPLLAVCGSYQMLGNKWILNNKSVDGLGIFDIETDRPGTSANRLVDNIAIKTQISDEYVVGFENHAGRTHLGCNLHPFGKVVSRKGAGNNEQDKEDGLLYKATIGTYLHGPILSKNPEIADWIIQKAISNRESKNERELILENLDDTEENQARSYIVEKIVS